MAEGKTPAEMQAMIWQQDSLDGVDHGASCAAFASMTLALGAHAVGQESWVIGGTTYPWPLHKWADVRVNPNPGVAGRHLDRPGRTAHHRWHALGDGYEPQPGDWVVFNGHVEVVTRYSGGALHTIGADSLPNFSVNAHEYPGPLGGQGVAGFVNNGGLAGPVHNTSARNAHAGGQPANGHKDTPTPGIPGTQAAGDGRRRLVRAPGGAAIPGASGLAPGHGKPRQQARRHAQQRPDRMSPGQRPVSGTGSGEAANGRAGLWTQVPGPAAVPDGATADTAIIPGLPMMAHRLSARTAPSATPAGSHDASHPVPPAPEADPQQAFIGAIAPGAVAAQRKYGVPTSVTIAQAIVESGWGESQLATQDHNLFGIKGTGPAGSDPQQTWEYVNGQQVTSTSQFRVYHNTAQSIDDHGRLLATSPYYRKPMADRRNPDAFAAALTGVYATDLDYGAKLISLMKRYDLYRYDALSPAPGPPIQHAAGAKPAVTIGADSNPGVTNCAGTRAAAINPGIAIGAAGVTASPSARITIAAGAGPAVTIGAAPASSPSPPAGQAAAGEASSRPPRSRRIPQQAMIPGLANAASPPQSAPSAARSRTASPGRGGPSEEDQRSLGAVPATQTVFASRLPASASAPARRDRSRAARRPASRYQQPLPVSVSNAFIAKARVRLMRAEPLYRDVADHNGIPWQLLAACDWMQCAARARYSPVHGEKLGGVNPDGTSYRTKSAALEQCADDLIELAGAVYGIELTAPGDLSIRDLANVFAAFRWGGLLRLHRTSAMEFPYSVAGLTEQYSKMHWPNIDEPNTPDKPGGRFRMPFGAVPVVLSLNYPATV